MWSRKPVKQQTCCLAQSVAAECGHINLQMVRASGGARHRAKRGTAQAERDVHEEVSSHQGPLGAHETQARVT